MAKKPSEIIDRLRLRSSRNGDCWEWRGKLNRDGYGVLRLAGYSNPRKYGLAHRLSYKHHFPNWDESTSVLHRCDNPRCWNPGHLFDGTQAENMSDMVSKKRSRSGERHPHSKLNREIVGSIRTSELGSNRLAKIYGVSPSAIDQVRWGNTWRQV